MSKNQKAFNDQVIGLSLAVRVDWHHDKQRGYPDCDTDGPRVTRCTISSRLDRSTHGQVTISAHHRQREYLHAVTCNTYNSWISPVVALGVLHAVWSAIIHTSLFTGNCSK